MDGGIIMTIVEKFEIVAKYHAKKTALYSDIEGELTYQKLSENINFIANQIQSINVTNNPVIAVCIPRSFAMVSAMLGCLKAGVAYLPLDPSYPLNRILYMLENSHIDTILISEQTDKLFAAPYHKLKINTVDETIKSEMNLNSKKITLACIMYTSGSTGTPNGVMLSNRAVMNTIEWRIQYYRLNEADIALQIPSYSYASSIEDIFSTLLSGGSLVIVPQEKLLNMKYLKHLIDFYSITHFLMVPSLYKEFVKSLSNQNTLRFVTLAGEPFLSSLSQLHYKSLPYTALYNEYGMTETGVGCMAGEISPDADYITMGKMISNMSALVLEKDERDIGELYISGIGLADGYHYDVVSTSECFIFIENQRYFKTGDIVQQLKDGDYLFIGRNDNQIKRNGQRLNLNEIDKLLQTDNVVKNSKSVAVELYEKKRIICFVQTEKTDNSYFYRLIENNLPSSYKPDYIVTMCEFIYLPNNKININEMKNRFLLTMVN